MNSQDNQVIDGWDQIWKGYRSPNFFGRRLYKQRVKTMGKILADISLPANAAIIDVGCGSGSTLVIFRSLGYLDAIGIDGATNSLKISQHLYGFQPEKDIFLRDARKTGFESSSFDLVFSQGVLEHYEDKTDALSIVREMCRLSRKYVLLLQPDQASLMGRLKNVWQSLTGGSWEKEFSYGQSDYNALLDQCAFKLAASGSSNLREEMWLLYTKE